MVDAYCERFLLVVFGTREGCRGEATFCVCAKVLNNFWLADGVLSEEEKRVRWKTRNSSSLSSSASSSAAEAAAEEMRFPAADMFQVIQSSKDSRFDIDYLGESTKGDMNVRPDIVDNFGESLFLFRPQNPQFLLYKVD